MASPNLSEAVTTTLRNRSGVLANNVEKQTALFTRLKERGKSKPFSGGRSILHEIEYAENGTFRRYAGYDTLNIAPSDIFTAAEFDLKQAAVAVSMSGLEELQNAGPEQVIDLMGGRIDNAERTLLQNLAADAYSDGTADGGKQMGGLALGVADTGLSTVGGIDSNDWGFWRNQVYDFSVNSVTPGSTTIQSPMNKLYMACCLGNERPDLIVSGNAYFRHYWESLQAIQRVTNSKMADAGFENLKFMGADVVFDGGTFGNADDNHMWFLNTKYIMYRPHRARNMVPLGGDRQAVDQDAFVKLIGWAGNMTYSNRRLQGVLCA